jgi:hypothetical protein
VIDALSAQQLFARKLLEQAEHYEWSLQGLGMFRLYLSRAVRLHVWDSRFAVPNVSTIHDHPWHFSSLVLSGQLTNRILEQTEGEPTHHRQRLLCGVGGHLLGEKEDVRLELGALEIYQIGDRYHEDARDLHESNPEDGTITLVRREFLKDPDHALVCFPLGTEWVSAEPRPATREEVRAMAKLALERMPVTE